MKKPIKKNPSSAGSIFRTYWIHLLFIFFLVNFVITRTLQLTFFAQNCLTKEMIQNDQRCLYIYGGNVYEKGSRNKPHHNNTCGSDVTAIIPSFHIANMAKYMDPNYITSYCANVVPTSTPQPTATPRPTTPPVPTNTPRPNPTATPRPYPTNIPAPTPTPYPTSPPQQQPTNVSNPTATPQPTKTPQPNPTATIKLLQQITPSPTQKSVPTSIPVAVIQTPTPMSQPVIPEENSSGFGRYLAQGQTDANAERTTGSNDLGILSVPSKPEAVKFWTSIIFWSELLTAGSFILVVVSLISTAIKYIGSKKSISTHA